MDDRVRVTQRVEAGAVAVLALVAAIALYPAWWWMVLALFLAFDLSMVGYLRSSGVGAATYNAVHNYGLPAVVGLVAVVLDPASGAATVAGVTACAWAFHVGVDRALGYGLKLPTSFQHTHLGVIGRRAPSS